MSDAVGGERTCSSCKCHKPAADFTSPKTCGKCAAKEKVKKRKKRIPKPPKGPATEGPPGTRRCSRKKWCPDDDFEPGNITCNSCLRTEQERKLKRRNSTAAMVEWEADEAEQLVVCGSDPVSADTPAFNPGQTTGQQQIAVVDGPAESQVIEPAAPLGFHYTPEGTEPVSDDVDAPMDDLTRSLGGMDVCSVVGQLDASDGSVNENNTMSAAEVSS